MKKIISITTVVIYCLQLSYAQHPGDLDSLFGVNGIVKPSGRYVSSIAIQTDNKILVAMDSSIERYDFGGKLDTTFVGNITKPTYSIANVAIGSDKKTIVASRGNPKVTLSRFNVNGSFDSTFGTNGMKVTDIDVVASETANDIPLAVQSDGKIITASSQTFTRFNVDGSVDKTGVSIGNYISSIALQKDNKILFAAVSFGTGTFMVGRFNTDGSLDNTFSGDGIQDEPFVFAGMSSVAVSYAIALQSDGKIVAAGFMFDYSDNSRDCAVARYNPDGSLDSTFSEDGVQITEFGLSATIYSLAIQSDGKIVAAGGLYSDFALARYNINGSADSSFSGDGKETLWIDEGHLTSNIAVSKNKLYLGGSSGNYPFNAVLSRYQLVERSASTVRITNPYDNTNFTAGTNITVNAEAIPFLGGSISKVEFYSGTALLSTDDTFPYSFIWSNVPKGNYLLSARVTDNAGAINSSDSIHITVVSAEPPIVSITNISPGSVYGSPPATIDIKVSAVDGDPSGMITKVEFYNGTTLLFSDFSKPFSYTWKDVPIGTYALTVIATDDDGLSTTSAIVNVTVVPNEAPSLFLYYYYFGHDLNDVLVRSQYASLQIFASDNDGYLKNVRVYDGKTLLESHDVENENSDYNFNYNIGSSSVGTYKYIAKATDNFGAISTSDTFKLTVVNSYPTVNIVTPSKNAIYGAPASILINTEATDLLYAGTSISKVEVYNGSTLLFTDNTYPFSYNWNNVPVGSYALSAKTTYSTGFEITSPIVYVSVVPPTISITSPVDNFNYIPGTTIQISANVTVADVAIDKVEFYSGETLLHTENYYGYRWDWKNVPAGDYVITAKAYYKDGLVITSVPVHITVAPNKPSLVAITSPAYGATFSQPAPITLSADASDPDGFIQSVEFYSGSTLLATELYDPYLKMVDYPSLPLGDNMITAVVTDNYGLRTISAPVLIHVVPNQPPILNITSPVHEATYLQPSPIILSADANDPDDLIKSIKFYIDNKLVFVELEFPYSIGHHLPAGNYSITAVATDIYGLSTTSAPVVIHVIPNQPPTLSLTSPADGATYSAPASIVIGAVANDPDGKIKTVEFYEGANLLRTEKYIGYQWPWKNVPAGIYTITAKATDNWGAVTTSSPVTVTVASTPGVISSRPSFEKSKTGLDEFVTLSVAPNPAKNILNISTTGLQKDKQLTLSIISSSGAVIKTMRPTSSTQTIQLNVASLVSGVYMIKMISGDKIRYKKFVKL